MALAWGEFEQAQPGLAGAGRTLLYQFGVAFACEDNQDAFYCTGRAHAVEDPATRQVLAELFVSERSGSGVPVPAADDHLFSFDVQRCLLTRTTSHGDPSPQHTVWLQPST